jgi:hypothetical protein
MALSRYAVIDAYTLEELRRQYISSDVAGRIRFLAQFRKADDASGGDKEVLPFDIVFMAAQDDSIEIRQWIARNGCFDLQNSLQNLFDGAPDPIDSIVNHLKSDPDPFVRACLFENQALFGKGNVEAEFGNATHLERLALVRNPDAVRWATKLIRKIFDPDDKELAIGLDQRRELALAFISTPEAHKDSHLHTTRLGSQATGHGDWDVWESSIHWDAIWRLAAKWPIDAGVAQAVFENISVDEGVKVDVYQQLEDEDLRSNILQACDSTEIQILQLGTKDSDHFCRAAAFSKIPRWFYDMHASEFRAVLNNDHKDALFGFVRNESLPVEALKMVGERLEALGDDFGKRVAQETIKEIERKQISHGNNGSEGSVVSAPHKNETSKSRVTTNLPFAVVLLIGASLVLGAPLELTLGVGLICLALISPFIRKR